jgi:hypothetical protein
VKSVVLVVTAFAICTCSALVLAILAPIGQIDVPMSRGMQAIYVPGLAWFAFIGGIAGLITIWRKGGVGAVTLTPSRVTVGYDESFEWADISDVGDCTDRQKSRKAVVLRLSGGSEKVIDSVDSLIPRGAALYWMVRHYWRHPEERQELTDGRAVERLHAGRFDLT